ncbi:FUSC family protein [Paraburkholderia bengalensis]|uniref:FUSC family protein n=1 Tax=Paraburkholderia bengalensis TaxID=2747562 RepID=A0ABU8IKD9_9BURK
MYDTFLLALRNTLSAFRAELSWRTLAARVRRCSEAVLATLVAVCVSRFFGLPEIWWAAICAFSLTGLALGAALDLGVQQIIGTFGGTVIGLLLSRLAAHDVAVFVLTMACLSAAGLYLATKRSAGYMWILSTALAIYIVATTHAQPAADLRGVAQALWINALIGTTAYLGVTLVVAAAMLLCNARRPAAEAGHPRFAHALTDRTLGRLPHTTIGAVTLSMLAYLAWRYPVEGFAQAMTTAIVVLMVPVDAQGTWSPYGVVQRMCHRLLGCALGCAVVLAVLPLTAGSLVDCLLAVCVFVWLACFLRFGHSDISYVGTQFGAVVILSFVHDRVWLSDDAGVAYRRLVGIAAGNVALAAVFVLVMAACAVWARNRTAKQTGKQTP